MSQEKSAQTTYQHGQYNLQDGVARNWTPSLMLRYREQDKYPNPPQTKNDLYHLP